MASTLLPHFVSKAEPQAEATKAEGGQEDKYEKYRKMLKMGLPRQAVENKMIQDGIDPACLTSSSKAEPQAEATKAEGGQEDKYEKYRKMLKMGLPR